MAESGEPRIDQDESIAVSRQGFVQAIGAGHYHLAAKIRAKIGGNTTSIALLCIAEELRALTEAVWMIGKPPGLGRR